MSRAVSLTASLWHAAGFAAVPARSDGSKAPIVKWAGGDAMMTTDDQLTSWFNSTPDGPDTYGLLTGNVSGGLEMFEFEGRAIAEGWLDRFTTILADHNSVPLFERIATGPQAYTECTPSGGIHFLFRVLDESGAPSAHHKNDKLASRPTSSEERQASFIKKGSAPKQLVMVETRSNGGFTVMAPSTDASCGVGDRGPGWVRTRGVPGVVPVLTTAERDQLYALARLLDRMPVREVDYTAIADRERLPWEGAGTGTPWDDFEGRTDWADILEPHGWTLAKVDGQVRYWRRPGKDVYGHGGDTGFQWSASTGKDAARDRLYVWSTSTEFEDNRPTTKGEAYAILNHSGDRSKATIDLASKGFGRQRTSTWADNLSTSTPHTAGTAAPLRGTAAVPAPTPEPAPKTQSTNPFALDFVEPSEHGARPASIEFDTCETPPEISACYLPDEFWSQRPLFGMLRQAAWAQQASPEGVLIAAIGLTLAHVMPNVALPACVGTEASLNLMTVLVGSSGDGKSTCRKLAKKVIKFHEPVHEFPPSSGQGISAQYQQLRKPKGGEPYMETLRWNTMALVEESDRIAALAANVGNTLTAELRQAAMGEMIGAGNMGDTKTNLPEHTYRFVLSMCLQPEQAEWLLAEKFGGLPQRFLFGCIADARFVANQPMPGEWKMNLPLEASAAPESGAPRSWTVMEVTDDICASIKAETRARKIASVQGRDTQQYDGHRTLLRLKVAGAFALMDCRLNITNDDWDLAGEVVKISAATISWTQGVLMDILAKKADQARKGKVLDARAITEATVEETNTKMLNATAARVQTLLTATPGMTKSDLRKRMSREQRELLSEVLDGLIKVGRVRFEDIVQHGQQVGSRWWLTDGTQ